MVEFALTLIVFLALLLGILDFGRGIFMFNGVAEAAREIARVTSVHPGSPFGSSPETGAVVDGQQGIIFELGEPEFACVDIEGNAVALAAGKCLPGNWVKVTIAAQYSPVTPILNLIATEITSSSSVQIP